jgi:hypothetical protein
MPPNFYYDQEDFLRQRQQGKHWYCTGLRPEASIGFAVGNPMNLGMNIAVCAAISKKLGLHLRFPGTYDAYEALYQVTSADILAEVRVWAGNNEAARDENIRHPKWQLSPVAASVASHCEDVRHGSR